MELYNGSKEKLKEDLKELNEQIFRSKTIRQTARILNILYTLGESYALLDEDDLLDKIGIDKYSYQKAIEIDNKLHKKYINNFIDNKKINRNISSKMIKLLRNKINLFDDIYPEDKKINDKYAYDLICDFLSSMDEGADKIFKELVSNKRLFNIDCQDEYNGFSVFNNTFDKKYVFVSNNNKEIEKLVTTVHEIGHLVDFSNLSKNYSKKDQDDYFSISSFIEVISSFYEYEFIKYLIRNKIEINASKEQKQTFFYNMFENFNSLYILSLLNNRLLENDNYSKCSIDEEILKINNNKIFLNDELYINSIYNSDIYSYGTLIGLYLSNLKSKDKDKFKYVYKKFLEERNNFFNKEILSDIELKRNKIPNIINEETKDIRTSKKLILRKE